MFLTEWKNTKQKLQLSMKYGVGWWNFNRNLNFEIVAQHGFNTIPSANAT
jgi:hypothetical protein